MRGRPLSNSQSRSAHVRSANAQTALPLVEGEMGEAQRGFALSPTCGFKRQTSIVVERKAKPNKEPRVDMASPVRLLAPLILCPRYVILWEKYINPSRKYIFFRGKYINRWRKYINPSGKTIFLREKYVFPSFPQRGRKAEFAKGLP